MKNLRLIPVITALALLYSPTGHAQTAGRETPAPTSSPTPTEVKGTVALWRPESGTILAEEVNTPVQFIFAKNVDCIDSSGRPVAREVIQPGDPVTIRYLREGDRLLVSRVIMERRPTPVPTASAGIETATRTASPTASKAGQSYVLKDLEIIRARMEKETHHSNEHHR